MGLGNGLVGLFKQWGKGIGNAADHVWLREEAQKAIRDEVEKKFRSKIDLANTAESKRATNIKDLDTKLTESKANQKQAQKAWQDKYDDALADAKSQRQTDIDKYNAQSKMYQDALDNANASRQSIFDKLADDEDNYDRFRTIFTDVNTGERFIFNHITGQRESLTKAYKRATPKDIRSLNKALQGYGDRLYDSKSNKVINVFDESNINTYQGKNNIFDSYYSNKISTHNADIRDAEKQIQQAWNDSANWTASNPNPPKAWDASVERQFLRDYKKTNGASPTGYSFNGKNYSDETALDAAYQKALNHAQYKRDYFRTKASNYASERDKEIAQRIQDAKDINKAKVALGGTLGAGALYAGARAMYGGDDTPDNTDNTYTGKPDPDFNVEKEGQAILKDRQQSDTAPINADFNPDKADALAAAAYDKGVEDGNSIETPELAELSADDIHTNEGIGTRRSMNEGLFSVIKALQDPHQANAVADYIYSRYGNDPELQQLGWRAWLNKYYGDALRSKMNLDASGYNGMHISGGL